MGRFLGGPGLFTPGGTQRRLFAHPYDNAILKIPTHVRAEPGARGRMGSWRALRLCPFERDLEALGSAQSGQGAHDRRP